jgi:SAM-dependent methyltransferase
MPATGMDELEYGLMYSVEDTHWWYRGMASITCALLDRFYRRDGSLRILDAGCGTGAAMTSYLTRYGRVWGFDLHPEAVRCCRRRGAARLARASVAQLPFADETFDLATSFEVLDERSVPSDREAVREIRRVLVAGGRLLIRLPAYSWMRRSHDAVVHTRHRYTRREVEALLSAGGFRIEQVSYANAVLLPAAMVKKFGERLFPPARPRSDLNLKPGPLNGLFYRVLSGEAPWIARSSLPFGLSVVGVGRAA